MGRLLLTLFTFAVSMALGVWGLQYARQGEVPALFPWDNNTLPLNLANRTPQSAASPAGEQSRYAVLDSMAPWRNLPVSERQHILKSQQYVKLQSEDTEIMGRVLTWDNFQVALLSNQGALKYVPWGQQVSLTPITKGEARFSPAQLQQALHAEFGNSFVIQNSAQFMVIQPQASSRDWARSMQQFYGNVQTYCGDRQIKMRSPEHPLVAIVFPDRASMISYSQQQGEVVGSNVLAYYSLNSNRVAMYDPSDRSANRQSQGSSELELETVFHEAFHQIAFNTGLHYRTTPPPMWVSEGMATAFEAQGLSDHRRSRTLADRVHRHQLMLFQSYSKDGNFRTLLRRLLRDDRLFQDDPTTAYALSWAVAFYWMEQSPQEFSRYLDRINRREMFESVTPEQREQDLLSLTRCSIPEFSERLVNYFDRIK